MATNEKKQKSLVKYIFIFVTFIVIVLLAGLAWAKYQTVLNGGTNTQIAEWHFDLQNCKGESATVKGIDFPMTRTDGNKSVKDGKLAPGTSGEFKMIVDTTNTQVLTLYNININLTDCPTNLKFYTDSEMKQELPKVEIGQKQENGETVKIHQLSISRFLPLDKVNRKHPETLYWRWLMETGDTDEQKYANNLEDSLWINKDTMTMDIMAIGEQVLEAPSQIAIRSINVENSNGSTTTAIINKAATGITDGINANIVLGSDSNSTSTINVSITNLSDKIYYFYDAKLVSTDGEEIDSDSIDYEIIGLTKSRNTTIGTELIPGSTVNFRAKFNYKDGVIPNSSNNKLNAIIKFEYKQVYNITYENFEDASNYPKMVIKGETITINMVAKIAKVKVTTNNTLMIQDDGFTYNNNILIIPNVEGNITIEDTGLRQFEGVKNGIVAFATRETSRENDFGDFNIINNENIGSNTQNVAYNGNNGKAEFNNDNSLKLDEDNTIAGVNISSINLSDEYSMYITVKADTNQTGLYGIWGSENLPGTIVAISESPEKYLFWLGLYKNYIHIYSYYVGYAKAVMNYKYEDAGFTSFDVSEHSNKIFNIQITATRKGNTKVYINGIMVKEFSSGQENISYNSIIIGDLRPGRGLKFTGNIYDLAFYSRALTEEEVNTNWQHAKETWNIE